MGQKSSMVWLNLGSPKAKLKVSTHLGFYLDILGVVHSFRWLGKSSSLLDLSHESLSAP